MKYSPHVPSALGRPLFMPRGRSRNKTTMNKMHPLSWIPPDTKRLLDVGCNVGELLVECSKRFPDMELAGVDVNAAAIESARNSLPAALLSASSASASNRCSVLTYSSFMEVLVLSARFATSLRAGDR